MSPIVHQFERRYRLSPELELRVVKWVLALDVAAIIAIAVWYAA